MWGKLFQEEPLVSRKSIEWQQTGSILLSTSAEESLLLQERQRLLAKAGIESIFLDSAQVHAVEPALGEGVCAGLLTESDAQLVGFLTSHLVLLSRQSPSSVPLSDYFDSLSR
jgi:glycine/D-amino acid oxidase-like deaminating enzyme